MKNLFLFYLFLFFVTHNAFSQPIEKLKFKKNSTSIYFFQKGNKSDTIVKGKNDLFYLVVPDSLKEKISILVENGQMLATKNDSIVKLNYMPRFNYESMYLLKEAVGPKENEAKQFDFKTLVNGASSRELNKIIIRIVNRKENGALMENEFFFRIND